MEAKDNSGGMPAGTKKPYEEPAIAWTEEAEVKANLASACGKIAGEQGTCDASPAS